MTLRKLLGWAGAVLMLCLVNGVVYAVDVVDTSYVAEAVKRGAILWDVRDASAYREGHIPGAVNIGDIGQVLRDPVRENWLPTAQIETLLGGAGIDPQQEVIVYSRKGDSYAHFGLTTLRYFGARDPKVYHGGLDDWKGAGKPVAMEASKRQTVRVTLAPQQGIVVWNDEMLARVRAGNVQIVDVRTPKEFSGDDVRAIRGGHVPGAINIPYEQNWVDPGTAGKLAKGEAKTRDGMALKGTDALKHLYAKLDPSKETVVYCQSGVRGSETVNVLRELGFSSVKLYKPSWLGYAAMLSAPVEEESFANIGALNNRIANLQSRIEELESKVDKAR